MLKTSQACAKKGDDDKNVIERKISALIDVIQTKHLVSDINSSRFELDEYWKMKSVEIGDL